ncbi:hypothetical protein M2151_001171 [Lachnospiraceae bacterium PH1-22]
MTVIAICILALAIGWSLVKAVFRFLVFVIEVAFSFF